MCNLRRSLPCLVLVSLGVAAHPARAQTPTPASLWDDFIYYVRVRNVELAQGTAEALLKATDGQKLLDVVEASTVTGDAADKELIQAGKIDKLKDVSEKLLQRLQEARINRAREKTRIQADIESLAKGKRPYQNALQRLSAAGQFAAPQMLKVLQDDTRTDLHPYVASAMVEIGQPLVNPLAVAVGDLDTRCMTQVALILADIGAAGALPYLKAVLGQPNLDADTRAKVQAAYTRLLQQTPAAQDLPAAEQFLILGRAVYVHKTESLPGYDPFTKHGILWVYARDVGLVGQDLPGAIFGDVEAMTLAKRALTLNPNFDAALSLWLMANLRRETHLLKGETDPTYPAAMKPAGFYLRMAGPQRQHDVLERALRDNDTTLALKAIEALRDTAGTDTLVNRPDTAQPLAQALYYPDRRVRYAAAFAMANARPDREFPGCFRVVPVLAEAIRQTATRYALVIVADEAQRNKIAGELSGKDLGYQVISAASLKDAADLINLSPGLDVIVTAGSAAAVQVVMDGTGKDGRLAGVPILAVTSPQAQSDLSLLYVNEVRKPVFVGAADAATLKPVLEDAAKRYAGGAISEAEAADYAATALKYLSQMALVGGKIYRIVDAQASLIQSLDDSRPTIVLAAAAILSQMSAPAAQRALATAALDANRPEDARIVLLGLLADSAIRFGNQLDPVQIDKVTTQVKDAQGNMAIAVSRVYGALSLPTGDVVKMILPGK